MTPEAMKNLAKTLQTAGQFPNTPFASPDVSKNLFGWQFDYADLVVSFADILELAEQKQASGFTIIADTIVLPNGLAGTLTGPIQRISMIARRIVIDGGDKARLMLNHDSESSSRSISMIVGDIPPGLSLISQSAIRHIYDLSVVKAAENNTPVMHNFGWHKGTVREGTTSVPIGYLTRDQPLHQVLNASFALVAGSVGENDTNSTNLSTANDMMSWILKWSGLQSDIAQMTQRAGSVRLLLPAVVTQADGNLKINQTMPPMTAEAYLLLAKTRLGLAKQVELDGKLTAQSGTVENIAIQFAKNMAKRDRISAGTLSDEISKVQEEVGTAKHSLQRAAEMIEKQQFDQTISKIHLDLELELDRIDRIVKASFEIAIGLASFAACIGAICMGVPADPSATGKKAQQGVQGLFGAVKEAANQGFLSGTAMGNLLTVMDLFKLPYTFLKDNLGDHQDNFKQLASASVQIMNASKQIYGSGGMQENADAIAKSVGEAVRELAKKPTVAEAVAAWDALEVEAVNALDVVINDANTAGNVKKAAANYKTSVQTVAIYGRLLVDQQGKRDEVDRRLASLVLRHLAEIEKSKSFDATINSNLSREELNKKIEAEYVLLMNQARRSFFESSYGFHRAQFYETYQYPEATPSYCATAADMNGVYSMMETDHQLAEASASSRRYEFTRKINITDREVLDALEAGNSVPFTISLNLSDFSGFSLVRLSSAEIRLNGEASISDIVGVSMESESSFYDRRQSAELSFDGDLHRIMFEYDSKGVQLHTKFDLVRPTPFTTWTLKVYKPTPVPKLKSIEIHLYGWNSK